MCACRSSRWLELDRRPRFLPSTYLEVACAEITVPIATSTFGVGANKTRRILQTMKSCLPAAGDPREQSDEADAAIRRGVEDT